MDEETKRTLAKLTALTEDNNRILHAMRRDKIIGGVIHFVYWIIIIGFTIVSYYYIRPYLGSLDSLLQTANKLKDIKF